MQYNPFKPFIILIWVAFSLPAWANVPTECCQQGMLSGKNAGILSLRNVATPCTDSFCLEIILYNNSGMSVNIQKLTLSGSYSGKGFVPFDLMPGDTVAVPLSCEWTGTGSFHLKAELNDPTSDDEPLDNQLEADFYTGPSPILNVLKVSPTNCLSDGEIHVSAFGAPGPFRYTISNRPNPQTIGSFLLLTNGSYLISVTDQRGCMDTLAVTVPDSCKKPNNKRFIYNKDAFLNGGDCSTLTQDLKDQAGSIWYEEKIDLTRDFNVNFDFFLGCKDQSGADGMAFVLQPISTAIGVPGGGLGYQNISPSLAVEFDTWRNPNFNDVGFDHIALMRNGNNNHLSADNLAGPVAISTAFGNAEDCKYHKGLVRWIASTKTLEVYVECELRIRYSGDIVRNIFNNDPLVYFGFTASTGQSFNLQQLCLNYVTGASKLSDRTICQGESIQVAAKPNFARYSWTPVAGVSNPSVYNPVFSPLVSTTYYLEITDQCGFKTRDSMRVTVLPSGIDFSYRLSDSCQMGSQLILDIFPRASDTSKLFSINGMIYDTLLHFVIDSLTPFTIFHLNGNCIANALVEPQTYTPMIRGNAKASPSICDTRGSVRLSALKGKPPYRYRKQGDIWQGSAEFTDLAPGTYFFELSDQTHCILTDTIVIQEQRYKPGIELANAQLDRSCCTPIASVLLRGTVPGDFKLDGNTKSASGFLDSLNPGKHQVWLSDSNGCVSDTLSFEVLDYFDPAVVTQSLTLCEGQFVDVGSKRYTTSGIYRDTFATVHCCDSIVVSMLVFNAVFSNLQNQAICEGSYIEVGTHRYLQKGVYIDSLLNSKGCDSVITTILDLNPVYTQDVDTSICNGSTYPVGIHIYSAPGMYVDSLRSTVGCDSVIRTLLSIDPVDSTMLLYTICEGDFVQVSGKRYVSSGSYRDTLRSAKGCDSTLLISIRTLPIDHQHNQIQLCQGDSLWIAGLYRHSEGIYSDTAVNRFGCDSIISYNLDVDSLNWRINLDSVQCHNQRNGALQVLLRDGVQPYLVGLNDSLMLSSNLYFDQLAPGDYQLFIRDAAGCGGSVLFTLNNPDSLNLILPQEIRLLLGEERILDPLIDFVPSGIRWFPVDGLSCDDCLHPVCRAITDTLYELVLTDSKGCEVRATIRVLVDRDIKIFAPTSFSPNGDQVNDWFFLTGDAGVAAVRQLRIFDRWGAEVFAKQDLRIGEASDGWNDNFRGQSLQPGVYVWVAEVLKKNGESVEVHGDVTLIR